MEHAVYFPDMGQCEPTSALASSSRSGCWSLWDYETEPRDGVHLQGRMLYASPKTDSPPVTLRLNLRGPHAMVNAIVDIVEKHVDRASGPGKASRSATADIPKEE